MAGATHYDVSDIPGIVETPMTESMSSEMGLLKMNVFLFGFLLLLTGPPGCVLGAIAMISVFMPNQYRK
jgi:hypothetical protein